MITAIEPIAKTKELLTHSRQDCFKVCRKKHYFAYELGIRSTTQAKALRFGINGHAALEVLGRGSSLITAMHVLAEAYQYQPEHIELLDWRYEHETLRRLIAGYVWRWKTSIKYVATEQSFRLPLINPVTGKPSRTFDIAGKIDNIGELEDRRLAVVEHKFLGEPIDSGADIWKRLQIDHQISLYLDAARRMGYKVDTVIYNVIRKPVIKPTIVPILDDDGIKIVLDRDGNRVMAKAGKPRQTSSEKDGWVLQTRPMTIEEWGEKLNADISARPEYYYVRQEIPRLDNDLKEYAKELWEIAHTIRDAHNNNRWYRTVNRNTCSWCEYYGLCTSKFNPDVDTLPEGFQRLDKIHPELES